MRSTDCFNRNLLNMVIDSFWFASSHHFIVVVVFFHVFFLRFFYSFCFAFIFFETPAQQQPALILLTWLNRLGTVVDDVIFVGSLFCSDIERNSRHKNPYQHIFYSWCKARQWMTGQPKQVILINGVKCIFDIIIIHRHRYSEQQFWTVIKVEEMILHWNVNYTHVNMLWLTLTCWLCVFMYSVIVHCVCACICWNDAVVSSLSVLYRAYTFNSDVFSKKQHCFSLSSVFCAIHLCACVCVCALQTWAEFYMCIGHACMCHTWSTNVCCDSSAVISFLLVSLFVYSPHFIFPSRFIWGIGSLIRQNKEWQSSRTKKESNYDKKKQ